MGDAVEIGAAAAGGDWLAPPVPLAGVAAPDGAANAASAAGATRAATAYAVARPPTRAAFSGRDMRSQLSVAYGVS
jgi:hypothetical protein